VAPLSSSPLVASGAEIASGQSRPTSSPSRLESTANGRMSEGVHVLLEDLLFWVLISLSLSLFSSKGIFDYGVGCSCCGPS
jgi:hypothetical protein